MVWLQKPLMITGNASLLIVLTYACITGFAAMMHGATGTGFPLMAAMLLLYLR